MECLQKQTDDDRKKALDHNLRCEIVRTLGTQMFCYDPDPQTQLCTEVAKSLVKKYPFMRDTGPSGYGSWEKMIIEKIHNLRARNAAKRANAEDSGLDTPKPKRARGRPKLSSVLTMYPPLKDTIADEVSIERDFTKLRKEVEKESPKKDVVLSLARQTYPSRRSEILSESSDVTATALLQQFPELTKTYVVSVTM